MNNHFTVFTDASYCATRKMGFFGVVVQSNEGTKSYSNKKHDVRSCEEAEIKSIEYALTILPKGSSFTLFNDCKAVIDYIMLYRRKKQKQKRKVQSIIKMRARFEKTYFEWMRDTGRNLIRECHILARKELKK